MPNFNIVGAGQTSLPRRLDVLLEQHERLGRLCDNLEAIADDLPNANPERCMRAAADLETLVPAHHSFEAGPLTEVLGAGHGDLLARIMAQHAEDEGLAFEIAIALEPVAAGTPPTQPETLGYMLRCFFNNYRRSMLVEELALRSTLE